MKNFLLLLAAFFLFNSTMKAQDISLTKSAMVILVAEAKTTYIKGSTYGTWTQKLIGTVKPSADEDQLLREIYGFLSTSATPETIYNSYNGFGLKTFETSKSSSAAFNPSNAKCGFFCQLFWSVILWIHGIK